jgi:hypothetical protein
MSDVAVETAADRSPAPDSGNTVSESAPTVDYRSPESAPSRSADDIGPLDIDRPIAPQVDAYKAAAADKHGPPPDAPVDPAELTRAWQAKNAGKTALAQELLRANAEVEALQTRGRPANYPESWPTDESAVIEFLSLPKNTQDRLYNRDREQRAAVNRAYNEAHQHRQQVDQTAGHLMTAAVRHLGLNLMQQFPDVRTEQDLQNLLRTNPGRGAAYLEAQGKLQAAATQGAQIEQQRMANLSQAVERAHAQQQQQHQAQWDDWSSKQDDAFIKAVPEARDPAGLRVVQDRALRGFEGFGFDEAELARAFQTNPLLRDSRVQIMLNDLFALSEARDRARMARPVPVSKPLMPGTSNGQGGDGNTLEAAAQRGDMRAYYAARSRGRVR